MLLWGILLSVAGIRIISIARRCYRDWLFRSFTKRVMAMLILSLTFFGVLSIAQKRRNFWADRNQYHCSRRHSGDRACAGFVRMAERFTLHANGVKWPGRAAVVVSVVHVEKTNPPGPFDLDGRSVPIITAYLFHAGGHENPAVLRANAEKSFQGSIVFGYGFHVR